MRFGTSITGCFLVLILGASIAEAGRRHAGADWQAEMEEVHAKLLDGKWRAGKKAAHRLAEEVLFHGWYDRNLKQILAELALYQAVGAANLGQRYEALWYWHIGQNLDPRIRSKDLAPYGEAGELLREFPLRQQGRAPPSFQLAERSYGTFSHAKLGKEWSPVIPYNAAESTERSGDIHVELIIDKEGQPHHPVILTHLHPIVVYGVLEALLEMPRLEPALNSGEPVASLFKYIISPVYDRWNQGGNATGSKIQ